MLKLETENCVLKFKKFKQKMVTLRYWNHTLTVQRELKLQESQYNYFSSKKVVYPFHEKRGKIAKYLQKYVWPLFNIRYESVKQRSKFACNSLFFKGDRTPFL